MESMGSESELENGIRQREGEIASADVWQSRAALEERFSEAFFEISSTGRILDRDELLAGLVGRVPPDVQVEDFSVRELTPDLGLVTYRSTVPAVPGESAVVTMRASIWRREGESWRMVYHQGTPLV
jgi:hypothetical protein